MSISPIKFEDFLEQAEINLSVMVVAGVSPNSLAETSMRCKKFALKIVASCFGNGRFVKALEEQSKVTNNQPLKVRYSLLKASLEAYGSRIHSLGVNSYGVNDEQMQVLIGYCPHLQHLKLECLSITHILFKSLLTLSKLHTFDIQWTEKIAVEGLDTIAQLNLRNLRINASFCTKITDSSLHHLISLSNLLTFSLTSLGVTDAGASALSSFTNLTGLQLDTEFTYRSECFSDLTTLTNLQWLSLNQLNNFLKNTNIDSCVSEIPTFTSLTKLALPNACLSNQGLKSLNRFSLTELDLSDSSLIDSNSTGGLSALTTLTYLNLAKTDVADRIFEDILLLTRLRKLDISSCPNITGSGVNLLAQLSQLTTLISYPIHFKRKQPHSPMLAQIYKRNIPSNAIMNV